MSDVAIQVEGLGKRYTIGGERKPYRTLRESITGAFRPRAGPDKSFWALKDVSFQINRGEVVGIIGRNGAGKSTLLKVLSRITEPTEGGVDINGRVGSLLEVGTGFHPELTGRENVYLNGAILGMKRAEITKKFDEIVAFAETEKFLDTPVKFYSSGMYTRLAFAVAAHLDPEILIVDEVLAVGDVQFQRKCLGKMQDVAGQGRTILFVSHNMAAVSALCRVCIYLSGGRVVATGPTAGIVASYQAESLGVSVTGNDLSDAPRTGSGRARFETLNVSPAERLTGRPAGGPLYPGCDMVIDVSIRAEAAFEGANAAVIISDSNGFRLIDVNTALRGQFVGSSAGDLVRVSFTLKNVRLKPATYLIGLWLGRAHIEDIDSVEVAHRLTFVDPPTVAQHTETFPGPYQCDFALTIS